MDKRFFYAIGFNQHTIDCIGQIIEKMRAADVHGRFARPENLHLTLQFIGDVDAALLSPLSAVLNNAADQQQPFYLSSGELGTFGRRQDILWQGIMPEPALDYLHSRLTTYLKQAGLPHENRVFRPHITLARQAKISLEQIEEISNSLPAWRQPVTEIHLMESLNKAGRRCYETIDRAVFITDHEEENT